MATVEHENDALTPEQHAMIKEAVRDEVARFAASVVAIRSLAKSAEKPLNRAAIVIEKSLARSVANGGK